MRSPSVTSLANLIFVYYQNKQPEDCPQQFKPQFYRRYVNGIFVMLKKKDQVLLGTLIIAIVISNSPTKKRKGNKISFLDICISRNNNALETSIFCTPTFSGVYTNFNSFLPTEYKRGLPLTLLCRTYNICSSYFEIHEEINHLKSVWQKNSFPFLLTIVFINF